MRNLSNNKCVKLFYVFIQELAFYTRSTLYAKSTA